MSGFRHPDANIRCMLAVLLITAATLVQPPARPTTGFRAEFLSDLDTVQKKIVDLATVMPANKYGWRPAKGVRSISEVYMHIAGGNYVQANYLGAKSPVSNRLEQTTDKARVLEELKRSFDQLRRAILMTSDADLDKPMQIFGTDTTVRAAFITALNHLHEHLGQSIAYARMNGVVPPWSGRE